jgi:hypothetical protein
VRHHLLHRRARKLAASPREDGQEDGAKESRAVGVEDGVGGFQLASIASTNEACPQALDWK